ncbi:MAG TPA: glycerol-3-phosphate 1-O-acyltransferase PlsY [Armatimonadota bacterium]|jgi:glycerol-3-phosphate acyltransferase PlsY
MALAVALVVVAYLVGGIPIGVLVARSRGVDLTLVGSGNIGASNVLRTLGAKMGIVVWLADLLKGLLPVVWSRQLLLTMPNPWPWLAAAGLAAILGHCFSPYLRFFGGRGVSTSLGVFLALDWRVGVLAFVVWIMIVLFTRYISLGSIVATICVPFLFGYLPLDAVNAPARRPYVIVGICIALLVTLKHVPNIRRLLSGTERKIGESAVHEPGDEADAEYR